VRPLPVAIVILASALACATARGATSARPIDLLEQAVAADPENLKLAADYRQLAIADRTFDRSIDFLEKLAKRKQSGPNIQISLALAYVDKVPTSGDLRRLYLGRDAMSALTKAIERQPSVLAYYMRGVINLFYNNFIFNRIPRGIADLEKALTLATPETPPTLIRRTYTAIGDGQFKLGNAAKAREVWSVALAKFPGDPDLAKRLAPGADVQDIVTTALYASRRVDTTLERVVPVR
jgi:tetratricopeptide (TPR) repeat protein